MDRMVIVSKVAVLAMRDGSVEDVTTVCVSTIVLDQDMECV